MPLLQPRWGSVCSNQELTNSYKWYPLILAGRTYARKINMKIQIDNKPTKNNKDSLPIKNKVKEATIKSINNDCISKYSNEVETQISATSICL